LTEEVVRVFIPYTPRHQFLPLHDRTTRWSVCVAHRRAGKTVATLNDLIRAAWMCSKSEPRFAYVAPTYAQAKDVAWAYLKRFTAPIPGTIASESELRVDLPNGARIRLYGADNYDRMRGLYLDGVVLDEFGDMDPRAWQEVVRPALSDRQGWAVFIGTPRGQNHFADLWASASNDPAWTAIKLPASQTGLLPEEELSDARRAMSPAQYAAEYECSFDAPVVGSYFGELIEEAARDGRICNVPIERGHQVHTAWDLGIGDSTAIWLFQTVGREVHLIDYIENAGVGLDWYAKQLTERGHVYGMHLVPHDAQARELGTGKTRQETLQSLGINTIVVPRHQVDDGINAARLMLPRCWFDEKRVASGLAALKNYRREMDPKRKTFRDAPLHDWASHGSDAFRYLAMGIERVSVKHKPLKYETAWIV
jgi:hypothetical protein